MAPPLKDGLNRNTLNRLASNLARAWPAFDKRTFVRRTSPGLKSLELKERVTHTASSLCRFLPSDYEDALAIVVSSGSTWDSGDEGDPLRGFAAWPLFEFIETNGLAHFDASMTALRELTHLFTAEFAVRAFIAADPERAFKEIHRWSKHKDVNVRRLASEGTRPRLPWAKKIPYLLNTPESGLAVLEKLKDDPTEYVRRSVGNHLNDIAKDHPNLTIQLCTKWMQGASKERRWVVERATRSLVKEGNPKALKILGFSPSTKIKISPLRLNSQSLKLGESLFFEFDLQSTSKSTQNLVVDYAVHFMKADGNTKPKVFKLKTMSLPPGGSTTLRKTQSFRPISTRKYYSGTHRVEIFVNGNSEGSHKFSLSIDPQPNT